MATIKDIARLMGVAPSTVARALNDHPHINAETKLKVRAQADALGYIAHSAASTMRSGSSKLIGFVAPSVDSSDVAAMAQIVAECCREGGYQLVLSITEDDPDKERDQVLALAGARVGGIVLMPTTTPLRQTQTLLRRIPFAQIGRRSAVLRSDCFAFDDELGMYEATKHLLGLGHVRIGYVGGILELSTGENRYQGYRRALKEAGIRHAANLVETIPPIGPSAGEAFRRVFRAGQATAVVLGGPRITAGVLDAVHEMRLSVPRDLAIIGFGDQPWMRWWGPGLSTIAIPVRDLAAGCSMHLVRRIKKKPAAAN